MGLEKIKKSLVVLDQSLDTLEEVILRRETMHNAKQDELANQIDLFTQKQSASLNNNFDKEQTIEKLDDVIGKISELIES